MKNINFLFALLLSSILFLSCDKTDDSSDSNTQKFGIFTILDDEETVEMDGTIGSSTLNDFNALEAAFPNINTINIVNCDGSSDDEVNLLVSAKVHQSNINTHLMNNGEIASGGVDFFIAGVQRTKGSNTKIGVHSWAGDDGTATDFPVGDANHQPYIDYYVSVGFTQQQSEDFYYFTINAAAAEDIHWMTEAEIMQYGLITQ